MQLHASGEDYLEAILVLQKEKKNVRSVELARHLNVSKPSVSRAVSLLWDGDFLFVDQKGYLQLTELGREVASKIYERHRLIKRYLTKLGVDSKTAETDACKIEHVISDETFQKLKEAANKRKKH